MTTSLEQLAANAEIAISNHERARFRLALTHTALILAVQTKNNLAAQRAARKTEAVVRLCTERPTFSISRAEGLAQLDPDYAEYKARFYASEVDVLRATLEVASVELEVDGAKLVTERLIAMVRASVGAGL